MNCVTSISEIAPDSRLKFELARQYQQAAYVLRANISDGNAQCEAAWRHNAIHAIELFLSAFLCENGVSEKDIRALQHDLFQRAEMAKTHGLYLETPTRNTLRSMSERREYLLVRYDTGQKLTSLRNLCTTLDEIAGKVAFSF